MYRAVVQTLFELSQDEKFLGAQIGFFSLLHTWGQDLHYHPHIHSVVLAGGLTKHNKWKNSSKKFFIPVKALAKKFRGKYLCYLNQFYLAFLPLVALPLLPLYLKDSAGSITGSFLIFRSFE